MTLYLSKFMAFLTGIAVCCSLQIYFEFNPVLAAAATGFLGSFIDLPKIYESTELHGSIYAGSFAGMCSFELMSGLWSAVLLALIGAALYLRTRPFANGFGGKLGTISFLSSVILFLAKKVW